MNYVSKNCYIENKQKIRRQAVFLPRAVLCQALICGMSSIVIDLQNRAEKMKHGYSDEAYSLVAETGGRQNHFYRVHS